MKLRRQGILLESFGQSLQICSVRFPIGHNALEIRADILVTVNELSSDGSVRLGVMVPKDIPIDSRFAPEPLRHASQRALDLTRPVGTSIVIRKRDGVNSEKAIQDLDVNGICISNKTKTLRDSGRKSGSLLTFYANHEIWRIIRLELTLMRN